MSSDIPNYYAIRVDLGNALAMFEANMANYGCVDIGETVRLMLADFFYGDQVVTPYQKIEMFDRVLVLNFNLFPPIEDQEGMMEVMGDIFWALSDLIRRTALTIHVSEGVPLEYQPSECFYTFDQDALELMVYVPQREGFVVHGVAALDGRAVLTTCRRWWPQYLTMNLTVPTNSGQGADY